MQKARQKTGLSLAKCGAALMVGSLLILMCSAAIMAFSLLARMEEYAENPLQGYIWGFVTLVLFLTGLIYVFPAYRWYKRL